MKTKLDKAEEKERKKKAEKHISSTVEAAMSKAILGLNPKKDKNKKRKKDSDSDSTDSDSDDSDSSPPPPTVTGGLLNFISGAGKSKKEKPRKQKKKTDNTTNMYIEGMKYAQSLIGGERRIPTAQQANGTPPKQNGGGGHGHSPRGAKSPRSTPKPRKNELAKNVLRTLGTSLGYDRALIEKNMTAEAAAAAVSGAVTQAKLRAALQLRGLPKRGNQAKKVQSIFEYELGQ